MPTSRTDAKATLKTNGTESESQQIARAQVEWLRLLARSVVQQISIEKKKN